MIDVNNDVLTEFEGIIREKYPQASFEVSHGDDPEGVYLTAIVDVEDTEEVFDLVVDRLLSIQIDEELPVYVIPIRPPERALEDLRSSRGSPAAGSTPRQRLL